MINQDGAEGVFINCPFDEEYRPLREALVFCIFDCGFVPRCALEEENGGDIRIEKIYRIIQDCRFGVHDISRVEVSSATTLPRFNVPLELGIFLGARKFGNREQKKKNLLILERERFRYRKYISDISGQDIEDHGNDERIIIRKVRNWLASAKKPQRIPGAARISQRLEQFRVELPAICELAHVEVHELTYNDYSQFVSGWILGSTP